MMEVIESSIPTKAVAGRPEQILLSDRDFALFEELMRRLVEPNDLVRSEIAAFNEGHFDTQGRYHW